MPTLVGAALLCAGSAFVAPSGQSTAAPALRTSTAVAPASSASVGFGAKTTAGVAACGLAAAAVASKTRRRNKTAARYTTQVVLPALSWLKTGLKTKELAPTELVALTIAGNDILVGKDEDGAIFCVANLCPHIGTPMSEGADVIGDIIVCPLHGSSFSTKTGELFDWCPSPPIIGPLTGLVVERKELLIFDSRVAFFGDDIEVLVDTNAKRAYEKDYWKGILDAQGKNDGTWY